MSAAATKKASVVAIEAARRRLRPPLVLLAPAQAKSPPKARWLIAAWMLAVAAAALSVYLGLRYARELDYVGAFVLPSWIMVPALAPLAALIYLRRARKPKRNPPNRSQVIPMKQRVARGRLRRHRA